MTQTTYRKFTCDTDLGGCGKKTKEPRGLAGFRGFVAGNIPKDVEIEYYDLCEKCGNKKIREQKLLVRVTGAASAGILSDEELKVFGQWGHISSSEKRIFIENLQKKENNAKEAYATCNLEKMRKNKNV